MEESTLNNSAVKGLNSIQFSLKTFREKTTGKRNHYFDTELSTLLEKEKLLNLCNFPPLSDMFSKSRLHIVSANWSKIEFS